jgi:hypothetical protein
LRIAPSSAAGIPGTTANAVQTFHEMFGSLGPFLSEKAQPQVALSGRSRRREWSHAHPRPTPGEGSHDALSPTRKQRVFLEPPRLLVELRSVDVVKTEQAPTPMEISQT